MYSDRERTSFEKISYFTKLNSYFKTIHYSEYPFYYVAIPDIYKEYYIDQLTFEKALGELVLKIQEAEKNKLKY
jgi:hypothetical protein